MSYDSGRSDNSSSPRSDMEWDQPDQRDDKAADEHDDILRAAEYAPAQPRGYIAPDLLGFRTPGGWYVCSKDAARIFERGCFLPSGSTPVWAGSLTDTCIVCGK